ncbi:MAG: PaaI family thioesterase [Deltaproteobacteria bacterium]|nr:PaaI family thioesterase [Deltaproteobacteria bacterium]
MMESLSSERKDALLADFSNGFIQWAGIRATDARFGEFESALDVKPHHRQQDGFIHAAVLAAMADHTAGYAAFTTVPEDTRILTIEFKINFLRPASANRLCCRARLIRRGRKVCIGESDVFEKTGAGEKHTARAMVTLMPVPETDLAGK